MTLRFLAALIVISLSLRFTLACSGKYKKVMKYFNASLMFMYYYFLGVSTCLVSLLALIDSSNNTQGYGILCMFVGLLLILDTSFPLIIKSFIGEGIPENQMDALNRTREITPERPATFTAMDV
ncbi:hypothetical protein RF11_07515 [Thelohanellus kitauei]|uniref:Uncharacterized protein n=1 Tax=Thelohanellus kitauei TaxID=669202 RepID=A0A0C2I8R6_THEKT|nr:hypothetical protein RF11_07515 [Thelohanellus kitauei]